ncbi:hypothetical protein GS440_19110 [Rhodococcus hoagii]|nr:hypothetical protein [Prescottella equi]
MHDYLVAVTHRGGDRIGTVRVTAASPAAAEEAAVIKLVDGRPISHALYRTKATELSVVVPAPC